MYQPYPYYYYQPYQQQAYPYYYPMGSASYQPTAQMNVPTRQQIPEQPPSGELPMEQSYIENILRLNRGKHATVYMTIEHETKTFRGIVEAAGRDHIIISDPESGRRYLLLMVYLDYVVFDEEIDYVYPYDGMQNDLATYPER